MTSSRLVRMSKVLIPAVFFLFAAACSSNEEPTPPEPARAAPKLRAPLEYKDVGGSKGGLRRAPLFSLKVPSLASELEVHSLLLQPHDVSLPTDRETLYEVRAGSVLATSGDKSTLHPTGDIWLVSKGSHVTLKAQGEIAVLRAISLAPASNATSTAL